MTKRFKIDKGYVYWWLRAPCELWLRVPEGYEESKRLPAMFFDTFQEALYELHYQLRIGRR
jgi:hypothetical protein